MDMQYQCDYVIMRSRTSTAFLNLLSWKKHC